MHDVTTWPPLRTVTSNWLLMAQATACINSGRKRGLKVFNSRTIQIQEINFLLPLYIFIKTGYGTLELKYVANCKNIVLQ
jgi:hypothetical protein